MSEDLGEGGIFGTALPDSAIAVRGGLPENISKGTGVSIDASGKLQGMSVNSGIAKSVEQLAQSAFRRESSLRP
jgi:hypothetical protein